ncbi:toll/interleukin-1 receptor domain-containing protein [Carboxylicivirga taeanensis]|uniref:toll/interleukin-1 receptor domain-containing protein n=1 Tax=Carboxylicivirga taeanensis TaxID=1416875 RepID=UPI003F6DF2F5
MGKSVLVFVSHSSEDKEALIEPIVADLEDCYINVWIDKRKILPGDNLRKSIFRDGLDKADIALIFFTQQSLKSSWVDKEIKHVLREEAKKGNNFDLNKIISIFDCKETYDEIADRYPELTDDLLHLMPENYTKKELGQLISAIWSKYMSLQGGDVETQRQLLAKEKQIFKLEQETQSLKNQVKELKSKNSNASMHDEFKQYKESGKIDEFMANRNIVLTGEWLDFDQVPNLPEASAFGLVDSNKNSYVSLSKKGQEFFKWILLNE